MTEAELKFEQGRRRGWRDGFFWGGVTGMVYVMIATLVLIWALK